MTKQWVMASGNKGKLKEFSLLLKNSGIDIVPQSQFNVPEAEETGLSFIENAIIKARNASQHVDLPAIADDSGLEVDALNGRPGIYSARFSASEQGDKLSDQSNNKKLLKLMEGVSETQRSARFICALAFLRHPEDPTPIVCVGAWNGFILNATSGGQGFGYDPLFFVPKHNCSAAELTPQVKSSISHRGIAIKKMHAEWVAQHCI